MADLIIKPSSGNSLVFQDEGGDAALTVGTTGNTTLAGTANNLGTVTAGTLGPLVQAAGILKKSGNGQNVWSQTYSTETTITDNSAFQPTGLVLDVGVMGAATDFIVIFNEDRRESSWNQTSGLHVYSTNGGTSFPNTLGQTMNHYDIGDEHYPDQYEFKQNVAVYYLSLGASDDIQFRLEGKKHGGSNNYFLNFGAAKSSITAIKVSP